MPTTVSTPRIVIVGGGMGGPAAAERTYVVHRADLLDTVKAAVPADWVRLGARCTAVEAGPFVAHLRFADGRQVEADVVIGADGYPIAGGQAGSRHGRMAPTKRRRVFEQLAQGFDGDLTESTPNVRVPPTADTRCRTRRRRGMGTRPRSLTPGRPGQAVPRASGPADPRGGTGSYAWSTVVLRMSLTDRLQRYGDGLGTATAASVIASPRV